VPGSAERSAGAFAGPVASLMASGLSASIFHAI
jgi:hypothetical protein